MTRFATTPPDRIASLDGWRTVAIGLVLLSHASFAKGFPPGLVQAWQAVFNGDLGVRVFFVLSAFLITSLLEREHAAHGTIDLRAFFVRRALRIWPLAFTALLVLAALQGLGLAHETTENWVLSATFLRSFGSAAVGPTAHFWSLAVEEQFYLLAPAGLLLTNAFGARRRAVVTLCAVIAVAVLTRLLGVVLLADEGLAGARSIFRYCDGLAFGALAALDRARVERWLAGRSTDSVVGLSLLAVAALEAASLTWEPLVVVVPALEAALIAGMLVASARRSPGVVFAALNSRPAAFGGRLSYSLYVWHPFFLAGFIGPLAETAWLDWRVWWVSAFAAAFAANGLVEKPFLRIKDAWRHARPRGEPSARAL